VEYLCRKGHEVSWLAPCANHGISSSQNVVSWPTLRLSADAGHAFESLRTEKPTLFAVAVTIVILSFLALIRHVYTSAAASKRPQPEQANDNDAGEAEDSQDEPVEAEAAAATPEDTKKTQ
jgi:hypothetical protein